MFLPLKVNRSSAFVIIYENVDFNLISFCSCLADVTQKLWKVLVNIYGICRNHYNL